VGNLKILCFSDVHGKADIVEFFVKDVIRRRLFFDAIVIAGDINNPQKPRVFLRIMESLSVFKKPVFYVKGNWDVNLPRHSVAEAIDLEESGPVEIGDYLLVGHGRRMKPFPVCNDAPIILVTHYPPFSIMDKGKRLEAPQQALHSGLVEINYLIARYKPIVHIFGHSHTYGGVEWRIGDILYVNIARLDRVAKNGQYIGNYCLMTFDSNNHVRIRWFFLNGSWRVCSSCGRKVHLPPGWTVCRKCANKRDLRFERLPKEFSEIKVKVTMWKEDRVVLREHVRIPLNTIANKEAYNDFVERIVLNALSKKLREIHSKVLFLSKDKIIEYYGTKQDGLIVPFSELLFSCDPNVVGDKLCALMRLFSKDKRVHVLWGVNNDGKAVIEAEYVLFNKELLNMSKSDVETISKYGFIPLILEKSFST